MSLLSVSFIDVFVPLLLTVSLLFGYWLHSTFLKPVLLFKKRGIPYINPWTDFKNGIRASFLRTKLFTDTTKEYYNTYPNERYIGLCVMGKPTLIIRDPELVKQMAIKDFDHFVDHFSLDTPQKKDDILSKNLISIKGEAWREMRSTLSPAFTSSKMRNMFVFMDDCAKHFVSHFEKMEGDVIDVEIRDIVTKFTNDVIASASFGLECNSLENPENEFYTMGTKLTEQNPIVMLKLLIVALIPGITKLIDINIFPPQVSKFFRRLVQETIKTREEKQILRPDMIHLLMEARKGRLQHEKSKTTEKEAGFATAEESEVGKAKTTKLELTDDDIAAQALIFFFAGFDTTASTMSFMALELAQNSEVQGILQAEIDDVLDRTKGNVTYEDITKMKYLDGVLSETLRMWTPGFQTDRACTKDYVIEPSKPHEKSYLIRRGDVILIPTIGFHFDPKYFPEPHIFNPERFNDENKKNIIQGTYLPFGVGPRNCIGSRFALLEIKILFFRILSRFSFVFTDKTQLPIKLQTVGFSMRPEGGFQLGLERR